jgi:hypothetical protein
VQTYVAHACDGGLVKDYADRERLPWRIVVHSQVSPPDAKTEHVIDVLDGRLPGYGGSIESRLTSG